MKNRIAFRLALICFLSIIPMGRAVFAQTAVLNSYDLGTVHSPKGFGLFYEPVIDEVSFDSFAFIADMYGVLTGQHSTPGFKMTYTRAIIFRTLEKKGMTLDIYGGPGLATGYGRDINAEFSVYAGLHGAVGSRFSFDRNIILSIEFGGDLALKANRDNRFKSLQLSLYKAGIYHSALPQIKIAYRFK